MNQIKPYLFYIVCGVLLLIWIAITVLIVPGVESPGAPATVEASKDRADLTYTSEVEQNLERRAEKTTSVPGNRVPAEVIYPERREDVERLLDDFLVRDDWKRDAQGIVNDYRQQLQNIQETLVRHSEVFDQVVTAETDKARWFQEYKGQTAELVRRAIEVGVLSVPPEPTTGPRFEVPEGDPGERRDLRDRLGLFTLQSATYPDQARHPELRHKFRIAQAVVTALGEARGQVVTNPNTLREDGEPVADLPTTGPVAEIVSWRWVTGGEGEEGVVEHARVLRFELELRGPTAALVAATAALDGIDRPIMVRNATTWSGDPGRRMRGTQVEADYHYDAPAGASVTMIAIDFRPLAEVDLAGLEGSQ